MPVTRLEYECSYSILVERRSETGIPKNRTADVPVLSTPFCWALGSFLPPQDQIPRFLKYTDRSNENGTLTNKPY